MIAVANNVKPFIIKRAVPVVLLSLYVLMLLMALKNYMLWQSVNLLSGLIALPFVCYVNTNNTGSKRFGLLALVMVLLVVLLPVKTLLYISLILAILFVIETFIGRLNLLPLLTCLLMSPFFRYIANAFSFPIRLMLTRWAGTIMQAAGLDVHFYGNVLTLKGNEFSVDPACMGLNMIVSSLMLGIIVIGILQKKYQQFLSLLQVLLLLLIVMLLNIVANLFRIMVLVQFAALPNTVMHEAVGIACLLVYVFFPAVCIITKFIKRYGRPAKTTFRNYNIKIAFVLHAIVLGGVFFASYRIINHDAADVVPSFSIDNIEGYTMQKITRDVTKLESDKALVYIKPIENFYNADHNPMICWRGSGYDFKTICPQTINHTQVYTANIEKDSSVLYTAWWYDNGEQRTISQLDWRWKMFKGAKPYSIINITCSNPATLQREVESFMNLKLNKRLLSNK